MVYGLYGGRLYSQVAELVPLAVHISIRLRLCYNSYNPLEAGPGEGNLNILWGITRHIYLI